MRDFWVDALAYFVAFTFYAATLIAPLALAINASPWWLLTYLVTLPVVVAVRRLAARYA